MSDSEIMQEFWHAGATTGSVARECRHGTLFFDAHGEFMEEGELEDYQAKEKANPELYRGIDGSASFTSLLGFEWSWDCPKCRAELLKYQNFLWNHRKAIVRFLNARLQSEKDRAAKELQECSIPIPPKGGAS